jgi:hypothetical protein
MPVNHIARSTTYKFLNLSLYDEKENLKDLRVALEKTKQKKKEFSFKDYLWIHTNETNIEKTIHILKKEEKFGNTYIGLSGLLNIKFAYLRNSENIIIFDGSTRVKRLWQIMFEEVEKDIDLETINSNIISRVNNEIIDLKYSTHPEIETLDLTDDELLYFQKVVKEKKFCFLQLNLDDTESFVQLSCKMKELNLIADTIYFSNAIELEYCPKSDDWINALMNLCENSQNALFIACSAIHLKEKIIKFEIEKAKKHPQYKENVINEFKKIELQAF